MVAGSATAAPSVIITIDVETAGAISLPDQVSATCQGDLPCGIDAIAGMLESRGYLGTFYLNVYEHEEWGEEPMRSLTGRLQSRGHDVALHTHPQWSYDAARPNMYDYDPEEQWQIISDGVARLAEWTGEPVVSHRAGAYTANADTIRALAGNGILLDSSLFLGDSRSKIAGLGYPYNMPSRIDGVVELPVSVYTRIERPSIATRLLPPRRGIGKVDINWIGDTAEAVAAMDALARANVPYIIVFLHSFSLISGAHTEAAPFRRDEKAVAVLSAILDRSQQLGLQVVTMREIATRLDEVPLDVPDTIPEVDVVIPVHKYAWRMARSNPGATAAIACLALVATFVAAWGGWLACRRRRPQGPA